MNHRSFRGNLSTTIFARRLADPSENGIQQLRGVTVNDRYDFGQIEQNNEHFVHHGELPTAPAVAAAAQRKKVRVS